MNEKDIAVVKNQQTNIMEDMVELKVMMTQNQKLLQTNSYQFQFSKLYIRMKSVAFTFW